MSVVYDPEADETLDTQESDPSDQEATTPPEPTEEELKAQREAEKAAEDREDKIRELLLYVVKQAEEEDIDIRYRLIRHWKRNDFYFNNIQRIFYDEVARDYRTIDGMVEEMQKLGIADDIKTINVYRAFAESIIAALAVEPPNVAFPPQDAQNPEDIDTSEAYNRAGELISNHIEAPLLLIKALTILFNSGVVCGYNYYKEDPSYGIISTPTEFQQKQVPVADLYCSNCAQPYDTEVPTQKIPQQIMCPNCQQAGPPTAIEHLRYEEEPVQWEDTPKGRCGVDLFGPTHVKLPLYARDQPGLGYAILRLEEHVAKLKGVYKDHADLIRAGGGDTTKYERWARLAPEYLGQLPRDLNTIRYAFFRPWYFNIVNDPADAALLQEEFPNGCMVAVIDDIVVDVQDQKLDDCWTITIDPRSKFIHGEPQGNALIPIQDAKNDIFNLGIQAIEFGIPETFAHPKTLNFQKYNQRVSSPGMVVPAVPYAPDKSLADGFHTIKTASLSNEYTTFDKSLDGLGQFVSGAFPSIYGGALGAGSQTATEYTESRSRALQRLQLTWQMISVFWRKMIGKAVVEYMHNLKHDEMFTKQVKGTYINVWIRKTQGQVGQVKLDQSGQLPQSWAQKKDFIMQLIGMGIPEVGQIVLHPSNTQLLKEITGMPDFYIPGECDRNKQYAEYYLLSEQAPVDQQTPSIPVDIDVDDHQVHMLVLKNILVDMIGIALFRENPQGYANCIAHYRMHEMALQAKTMTQASGTPEGQKPNTAANSNEG